MPPEKIAYLWTALDDTVLAAFKTGPRKPIDVIEELCDRPVGAIPEQYVKDTLKTLGQRKLLWADVLTKTLVLSEAGAARVVLAADKAA